MSAVRRDPRWARKALPRRNGLVMRDLAITFAIGRDEAAIVIARRAAVYGETPATRREAMEWIESHCFVHGRPSSESLDCIAETAAVAEAYAVTDRLFPELAGGAEK